MQCLHEFSDFDAPARDSIRRAGLTCIALGAVAVFAILLVPSRAAFGQTGPVPDLEKAADEVLQKVAELRGLKPKASVQRGVKSRDEIARYLNDRVRDEYQDVELEREGRLLKRLGLLPPEMKYKEFTLKLLTEQVGGYYDPDKKTFFIAGWLPVDQQRPVMAHELTHALQDQHFDLQRFLKRDRKLENDDRVLAHQALVEGDGMGVMLDFVLEPLGKKFSELPNLVTIMRAQFSSMDGQFDVFGQAPLFLRETLLFPYVYGAAFLQQVRSRGAWSAVDRAYRDLPESTEQIIHPEKYIDRREGPQTVDLADPAPRLGKTWRATYRNVLGEFSLMLILKLNLPEERALAASAGWAGDRILMVEEEGGSGLVVFSETVWDTEQDASEFFEAWVAALRARFPEARAEQTAANSAVLVAGEEYHAAGLSGKRVRAALGLPLAKRAELTGYWP